MLPEKAQDIVKNIDSLLSSSGFEVHPFKVGWYNDKVSNKVFVLPYDPDTLAILVISTPDMFDKALIPYITRAECCGKQDMVDQCVAEHFLQIKKRFPTFEIEAIHDFELLPSRRPKVLMQTAGHVAGAAYYYQRSDVVPDPWGDNKKIFGVSVHPKYGGWFALRGVLIVKNVLYPELVMKAPKDVVATAELREELLNRFNTNWQDWTFRDIVPVEKKYSSDQMEYFATLPKDRMAIIEKLRHTNHTCNDTTDGRNRNNDQDVNNSFGHETENTGTKS